MDCKSSFFYQLSKLVAAKYSNYCINTKYHDNKEDLYFARKNIAYPLLEVCEAVHIINYDENWKEDLIFETRDYPWVEQFGAFIEPYSENNYKIAKSELFNESIEGFWLSPTVHGKNKKSLLRDFSFPGIIIVECGADKIPIQTLANHAVSFSSVNNPYSGRTKSARRWLKSKFHNEGNLYIPYESPTSFHFLGAPGSLELLVDRCMNELHLKDQYREHCPSFWLERYDVVGGDAQSVFLDIFG